MSFNVWPVVENEVIQRPAPITKDVSENSKAAKSPVMREKKKSYYLLFMFWERREPFSTAC